MATTVGIGTSNRLESFQAGKEAALAAHRHLLGPCDFILIFASTIFDQEELFKGIKSVFQNSPIIGCSSPAQISNLGITRNSVTVFAFKSDTIKFSLGIGEDISQNARSAGQKVARYALKSPQIQRQLFIIFPDGFTGSGSEIIRGAQEILGTSFPIIGGSAGDEFKFQKSFQYFNGSIFQDSVPGILLGGSIKFSIGVKHSWLPIGKPHIITKSRANIIKELDNKPAVEIYEEYFEKKFYEPENKELAKLSMMYPLGVRLKGEEGYIIRPTFRIAKFGALVLPAEIAEGSEVQLMIGDKALLLESAKEASQEALKKMKSPKNIRFALVFSSVARLRLLGREANQEINYIRNTIGNNVPIIGFYTFGEQAPFLSPEWKGQSHFQSHTIMVVIVGE